MSNLEQNKETMDFYDSVLIFFKTLDNYEAKVGVHADAGQDNVNKALWNEFGTHHKLQYDSVVIPGVGLKPLTKNTVKLGGDNDIVPKGSDISIPARPFIRLYLYPELFDKLVDDTVDYIDVLLSSNHLSNDAGRKLYERMGATALDLMHSKMEYRKFDIGSNDTIKDQEHNSLITQKIKGKDTPLFNTGELYDVMDYKVKKRGL